MGQPRGEELGAWREVTGITGETFRDLPSTPTHFSSQQTLNRKLPVRRGRSWEVFLSRGHEGPVVTAQTLNGPRPSPEL